VQAVGSASPGTVFVFDRTALAVEEYSAELAVRLAYQHGVAALIVSDPERSVPVSTVRLANKLGLPVLGVRIDDALALANELAVFVRQPEIVRSATTAEVVRALRRPLESIHDVTAILADGLGCEVGVADRHGIAVAGRVSEAASRVVSRRGPELRWADAGGEAIVALSVTVGKGHEPSLWLVAYPSSVDQPRREAVARLLEIGSWALRAYVTEQRLALERDARFRANLLAELLASRGTVARETRERAALAGWHLDGWHSGVYILLPSAPDPAEVLQDAARIGEALSGVGLEGQVVDRSDGWSFWTTEEREPLPSSYPELAHRVREALRRFGGGRDGMRVSAGVGRPFLGPEGIAKSLTEAREAALLAQANPRPVAVVHFDGVGLKRLLVGWYASDVFVEFAEGILKPLRDIDPGGALLATLECYLDCESSVTETAAALGVHRNTVMRRIARVCSKLGTTLTQPDERLALQLACRVARVARAGKPGS